MSWENLNILPFSYTMTFPIYRLKHDHRSGDEIYCNNWDIYDKGSEKSHPRYEITYEKIREALFQLKEHIVKTPLLKVFRLREDIVERLPKSSLCSNQDFHIYLKRELDQRPMNSVKARGVIYTLLQLSDEQKRKGVIAISTGTFACILCFYGKKFGIPVTVVLLKSTAAEKVQQCQDSLATVIIRSDLVQAHKFALRTAMTKGLFYLDGDDHPNMIIGQATVGIEIFELNLEKIEKLKIEKGMEFDAVILPTAIDGSGLTMAMAMAIKKWNENIKVFEVLPTYPDFFNRDVRLLHKVNFDELSELGIKNITVEAYAAHAVSKCIIEEYFDGSIKVTETEIQDAADLLLKEEDVIDSNAAIGLAAILSGKLTVLKGKRVLLPVFGSMDSSTELTQNSQQRTLESHAGPSRLLE